MALIVDVKMTILDLPSKTAAFAGTITDDVTEKVIVAQILETRIDTNNLSTELVRITDGMFADYLQKQTKQAAIDELIATWEAALTSALQAKVDE